jgi:hypothetical protein
MDLKNFKETTRVSANKAGFLHREWVRVKYWFVPPTNEKRKERFTQYKDFAIFAGAILVVTVFEDRISQLFEVDTNELMRGI